MSKTKKIQTVTKKLRGKKKQKVRVVSPWYVLGVLFFVLALIVLPPWIRKNVPLDNGARVPEGATSLAIDISHYNGWIKWDSLKIVTDRSGRTVRNIEGNVTIRPVSAVIIKATEGESSIDEKFREYWVEAGKRGYVRAAYHFFRSSKDPEVQANNFISQVSLRSSDLPPVLDIETMHTGCTRKALNEKALIWLGIVEDYYGVRPIVYTSDKFALNILSREITSNYPMWIARYNDRKPRFQGWKMWQFTDMGIVTGIDGYTDLSVISR